MISQGLVIMVIGMGVVFAFLCLLVAAMYLSAAIVPTLEKIFPPAKTPEGDASKGDNLALVAAAVAAVMRNKPKN